MCVQTAVMRRNDIVTIRRSIIGIMLISESRDLRLPPPALPTSMPPMPSSASSHQTDAPSSPEVPVGRSRSRSPLGVSIIAILLACLSCGARTEPLEGESLAAAVDGGDAADDEGTVQSDGAGTTPVPDATAPGPDSAFDAPFEAASEAATCAADADAAALADSGCGPCTCSGCCASDGTCVLPDEVSDAFCGSGGFECIACPAGITCGVDTSDGTRVCAHFL
jgi:hypothetical protein